MLELNKIHNMDCLAGLKLLPDNFIDMCVTSPPYYALRDYGVEGQVGLEKTLEEYISKLVEIFEEVRRVLKTDGTLWLNMGDSYAGSGNGSGDKTGMKWKQGTNKGSRFGNNKFIKKNTGFKPKDLMGVPWMLAFALRSAGWYLRQDIIWSKPNPMPESVTDRCTKAHEYIFLLSKSQKYYYDAEAIAQPIAASTFKDKRLYDEAYQAPTIDIGLPNGQLIKGNGLLKRKGFKNPCVGGHKHKNLQNESNTINTIHRTSSVNGEEFFNETGKSNKRSVWNISTSPYREAHFATFPEELIAPCIKAGSAMGGGKNVVLDPFMGAGTTALVALKLNRQFIGFELNPEYVKIANKRIEPYLLQPMLF